MTGLFDQQEKAAFEAVKPLAAQLRPTSFDEFVGQTHIIGPQGPLSRIVKANSFQSLILSGPPGTGKTTFAQLVTQQTGDHFVSLNATESGVKGVREILAKAADRLVSSRQRTLLFLDEVHHFSKSQQDILLPDLEQGTIRLIAATTGNPYYVLISALLSRSSVWEFRSLEQEQLQLLLARGTEQLSRQFHRKIDLHPSASQTILDHCDGDARRVLNLLEAVVRITLSELPADETDLKLEAVDVQQVLGSKSLHYDRDGNQHYDTISALIKSMRGTDPDAAIYWLARMLVSGDDPRFIARRLVIFAAEDIGNADPRAISVAMATAQAVELVGMPECRINLAQAVTYLATAPKSNASYVAVNRAWEDVKNQVVQPVPQSLRSSAITQETTDPQQDKYQYPHDYEGAWIPQDYLGVDQVYYSPSPRGYEARLGELLSQLRTARNAEGQT